MKPEDLMETTKRRFSTEMKALNSQFLKFIVDYLKQNPSYDMSPSMKDYMDHVKNLDAKFCRIYSEFGNSKNTMVSYDSTDESEYIRQNEFNKRNEPMEVVPESSNKNSPFLPISGTKRDNEECLDLGLFNKRTSDFREKISNSSDNQNSKPLLNFIFSQKSQNGDLSADKGNEGLLSWKNNSNSSVLSNVPNPGCFSVQGGQVSSERSSNDADRKSADPEDEPPKTVCVLVEEPDAIFSAKCKLLHLKNGAYQQLGVAQIFIKESFGKKAVLVRQATSIGKILLNVMIDSSVNYCKIDDVKLRLACIVESSPSIYVFRFGEKAISDRVMEEIDKAKST